MAAACTKGDARSWTVSKRKEWESLEFAKFAGFPYYATREREREGERREKKTQTERSKAKRNKTGILHLRCAGVSKMLHQSVTLHLFTSACRSSRNFWRPIAFLYSKSSATTDVQRLSKTLLCPQQYCMMPKLACGSCAPSYPTKRHAEFVRMWEWCFG